MTVLDRVPVEAIGKRVADVQFGRMLAALVGGLLYLLGWLPAKAVRLAWFALAWGYSAVAQGAVEAWAGAKPAEVDR